MNSKSFLIILFTIFLIQIGLISAVPAKKKSKKSNLKKQENKTQFSSSSSFQSDETVLRPQVPVINEATSHESLIQGETSEQQLQPQQEKAEQKKQEPADEHKTVSSIVKENSEVEEDVTTFPLRFRKETDLDINIALVNSIVQKIYIAFAVFWSKERAYGAEVIEHFIQKVNDAHDRRGNIDREARAEFNLENPKEALIYRIFAEDIRFVDVAESVYDQINLLSNIYDDVKDVVSTTEKMEKMSAEDVGMWIELQVLLARFIVDLRPHPDIQEWRRLIKDCNKKLHELYDKLNNSFPLLDENFEPIQAHSVDEAVQAAVVHQHTKTQKTVSHHPNVILTSKASFVNRSKGNVVPFKKLGS